MTNPNLQPTPKDPEPIEQQVPVISDILTQPEVLKLGLQLQLLKLGAWAVYKSIEAATEEEKAA